MEEKRFGDYINIAIEREEEAYEFYMDLTTRIEDKAAKDTLTLLADEEKKHKQFLINYRDGNYGASALRMNDPIDYKIAEHLEQPDIIKDMTSADVYLVAAHREQNSYKFYSSLAELHPEGELRDLFKKIAREELRHKEKVEYLYSNAAFPQTDGG